LTSPFWTVGFVYENLDLRQYPLQASRLDYSMQTKSQAQSKGLPGAQTAKATDLVNYQDGAVVSREILKKPAGNVTLFAFDEGQGLSEHTAPFDALVYLLEGEAEITISGQSHRVRGGEMILMPANQPHALKALQPFKMMLIMIRSQSDAIGEVIDG
jgi:quercetin dioxygenase-like cupin family protein